MSGFMTDWDARLAELARAATPRAGKTRVLAIDGRSGAGKSTLAAGVAETLAAPHVSLEQLYGSWDGLRAGIERLVSSVLVPLADGRPADVPRYDWESGRWLSPESLAPPAVLIVEGVGAGALAGAQYVSVLAWVELPEEARRARAMARDGAIYEGHWEMWREQEEDYLRSDRPAQRADLVVDGSY
jgi:uridine kinase